ncbi:hypothetical protein ACFQV4_18025 [Streptomyces thermocarboxydus]|uniref:Uncharacterized protein n=1 Tax=Streptomyces thermodiastaticus TaxID=44061 RepID=A0ABU0KEV7_9ACTN|nr:hypothetical protein [Streptomyces thermodiastaticus]
MSRTARHRTHHAGRRPGRHEHRDGHPGHPVTSTFRGVAPTFEYTFPPR